MVVNKKRPNPANAAGSLAAAPSGMGSRTSSSQQLPKASAKHTTKDRQDPTVLSKNPKNQKNTSKARSKRKKSSSGWLDTLLLFSLSLFTFYAFSTCPSDTTLHNPLCRSLSQYKTHVLDPYVIPPFQEHVIPPIQRVLEHPNIHPTVIRLQEAQRRVAPYVEATRKRVQPHVVRTVDYAFVQVEKVWDTVVVPRYRQWIQPHIQPYLDQFQEKLVGPYIQPFLHKSSLYLHFVAVKVREAAPHVDHAFSLFKRYTHLTYVRVKPYGLKVWESLKPIAIRLGEQIGELRRIYVDPHVWTIWEKVVELSGSAPGTHPTSSVQKSASTLAEETKATSIDETTASSTTPAIEVVSTAVETVVEAPKPEVPEEPVVAVPTESPSSSSSIIDDKVKETLESASSVMASRASVSPSSTPEKESQVLEELASAISSATEEAKIPVAPAEPEPEPASSPSISETATSASSPATETGATQGDGGDEVDSFLSELGLDESVFEEPPPPPVFTAIPPDGADAAASPEAGSEPTEEEKAEMERQKKETVAAKRKNIEDRHSNWEKKILQRIMERMTETVQFLEVLRDVASGEVLGKNVSEELAILELYATTRKVTHVDDLPVGGLLDTLEKEGDKLLSGLEGWVKREEKAGKPGTDQRGIDEKLRKWTQVVSRVEERFQDKVTELQSRVHDWYRDVRQMEVDECLTASAEIKGIAQDAQADIGLDYAWLEDVTYNDWQRYHDLMRAYEGFDKQIREVQSEVEDPLVPALDELQKELDALVLGFDMRVREINSRGRGIVSGEEPEVKDVEVEGDKGVTEKQKFDETPVGNVLDTEKGSEPIAIGSIPLKEETVQAAEEAQNPDKATSVDEEPAEFSILPVEEEAVKVDPAQVVIGKSAEQVEQAIRIMEENEARNRDDL
ncbi:hypothetical protein Moror_11679 [Moniliophthora roreri MCA 2997]|uniref:Uncharacterized protein n=2 Tax=Moniliophthora roreri TaxID=221103 RepID=V2Y6V5_MONRO|nr:hypothetical protein Moror_11679 [Moniliophthora roreri MCA 2997]KAI3619897.1 hypothetical protein WG66_002710 [Moniliophthora roreri]